MNNKSTSDIDNTDDQVQSCNTIIENQIINLNVGGQYFSTSKSTLTSIPDTFFTR